MNLVTCYSVAVRLQSVIQEKLPGVVFMTSIYLFSLEIVPGLVDVLG